MIHQFKTLKINSRRTTDVRKCFLNVAHLYIQTSAIEKAINNPKIFYAEFFKSCPYAAHSVFCFFCFSLIVINHKRFY